MVAGGSRTRVLFVAEAVTLAHVSRLHALARLLDPDRYEICIVADPRYNTLIGTHPFEARAISTISSARFTAALARGAPIYDAATLSAYVEEDLRAIEAFAPDVVVGDFRLSLNVSARLAQKPYINVINAGWSPYAETRFTVPDIPLARGLGAPIAQRVFDLVRPIAFLIHAMPLNALRRRHGLPTLSHDLRQIYTDADFVLYADLPEMFSMRPLPSNHAFLGAVLWSPDLPLPSWWHSLPDHRPVVYVTLGSSGMSDLLRVIVSALADADVTVIAATAGRVQLDEVPANTFVADYIPGQAAARRARLVICNGGSPTCYQALASGVPILGIPGNLDQFLNMAAVESAGAGVTLRPENVTASSVAGAVAALLRATIHQGNAMRLAALVEAQHPEIILDRTLQHCAGFPTRSSAVAAEGAVGAASSLP